MSKTNPLPISEVHEPPDLVLLILHQGLVNDPVNAAHVRVCETFQVENAGSGDDDPPAVPVPLGRREQVAQIGEVLHHGYGDVQVVESYPEGLTQKEVPFQGFLGLGYAVLLEA